jgi:hypothetical protein
MIKPLLVGCARALFTVAVVLFVGGAVTAWASYRLLKLAWKRDEQPTTREAGFQALASLARLAGALGVKASPRDLINHLADTERIEP